jgi:hypothetical protein
MLWKVPNSIFFYGLLTLPPSLLSVRFPAASARTCPNGILADNPLAKRAGRWNELGRAAFEAAAAAAKSSLTAAQAKMRELFGDY